MIDNTHPMSITGNTVTSLSELNANGDDTEYYVNYSGNLGIGDTYTEGTSQKLKINLPALEVDKHKLTITYYTKLKNPDGVFIDKTTNPYSYVKEYTIDNTNPCVTHIIIIAKQMLFPSQPVRPQEKIFFRKRELQIPVKDRSAIPLELTQ